MPSAWLHKMSSELGPVGAHQDHVQLKEGTNRGWPLLSPLLPSAPASHFMNLSKSSSLLAYSSGLASGNRSFTLRISNVVSNASYLEGVTV